MPLKNNSICLNYQKKELKKFNRQLKVNRVEIKLNKIKSWKIKKWLRF